MGMGAGRGGEGPRPRTRVLLVEDDRELRELLNEVLGEHGYQADGVADAAEALLRLRETRYGAIVLDKNMPGLSGLDVLPGFRTLCPGIPVIMISAFGDPDTRRDALDRGASDFLVKPFRLDALVGALTRALGGGYASSPPMEAMP